MSQISRLHLLWSVCAMSYFVLGWGLRGLWVTPTVIVVPHAPALNAQPATQPCPADGWAQWAIGPGRTAAVWCGGDTRPRQIRS